MPETTTVDTSTQRDSLVRELLQVTWTRSNKSATYREQEVTINGRASIEMGHGRTLTFVSIEGENILGNIFLSAGPLGALSRQEALDQGLMATEAEYFIPFDSLFTEEYAFMLS